MTLEAALNALAQDGILPLLAIGVVFFAVLFGVYYVMTARPRAEGEVADLMRELEVVSARLEEAEHIGGIGSFVWDFENPQHTYWTPETYALFGLVQRRKPPAVNDLIHSVHEGDQARFREEWMRACAQKGDFSLDFRTVESGKVRYVRLQGKTELGDDRSPRVIRGVARDITKETEVDRAKTEFVSLASHQLKTPLTSINWVAEAMLSPHGESLSDKQRAHIQNIHDAGRRMIDMVNDLLNVSRLELGTLQLKLEEVDLCALTNDAYEEQRTTAEKKGVKVEISCEDIPHITADKSLARMVLQNLLSNAIKYTPSGGSVTCSVFLQGATRDMVFIDVSDTGIGIPKADQDKVFEKLHRAKNAQEQVPDGTGLGLYLVKKIIERAGGAITFESTEGKGTTFHASFPLSWQGGDKDVRAIAHQGMIENVWQKLENK